MREYDIGVCMKDKEGERGCERGIEIEGEGEKELARWQVECQATWCRLSWLC